MCLFISNSFQFRGLDAAEGVKPVGAAPAGMLPQPEKMEARAQRQRNQQRFLTGYSTIRRDLRATRAAERDPGYAFNNGVATREGQFWIQAVEKQVIG